MGEACRTIATMTVGFALILFFLHAAQYTLSESIDKRACNAYSEIAENEVKYIPGGTCFEKTNGKWEKIYL